MVFIVEVRCSWLLNDFVDVLLVLDSGFGGFEGDVFDFVECCYGDCGLCVMCECYNS